MSLVLFGPRRVYVMLVFWQRLGGRHDTRAAERAWTDRALAATERSLRERDEDTSRFVLSARLHRVIRRRLIGLTLLVLEQSRRS